MSEPLKVKFSSPLIDTPRTILGPHYLMSSDKQTMDRLHLKVEMSKLTAAGFKLYASTRIKEDSMFYNWMVLPEIKSTILNSGEVDLQPYPALGTYRVLTPALIHYFFQDGDNVTSSICLCL
ncbi:hypothetical protein CF319_g3449 [Tilletia indica]|nr:hypothetical protein CF319_g3449 [Tilletia indica]